MKHTVYLYWIADGEHREGGYYAFHTDEHLAGYTSCGRTYTLLDTKEVDFDVKAFDARQMAVESLQKAKAELIAETTMKAKQIDDKIQQLLALPAAV
jgi:hypothetical protein